MDEPNPNPFGFVDHTAFAGFGVDLVWGLDADGEAVHISAAKRGLACGLICPACKATLIARKGPKMAAHFSHQARNSGCGSGRETNAHYWAKQLLVERKGIWTPVVTALVEGVSRRESEAKWMEFSDVRSERRLGRIVPDIVLILRDGRELIVEICVTHACGDDKIALIQANRWPAIEINLRHLRTSQDIAAIERGLLKDAPRSWLCNPRRDRAEEKLRVELAATAAARAEAARRKAAEETDRRQRELDAIETDARDLLRAAATARRHVRRLADPELAELITQDGGELVGISGTGEGFAVTREEWQATVIDRFVHVHDVRTYEDRTFSLRSVLDYLEPLIASPFVRPPRDKVRAWIHRHHPAVRFPHEAIEDYLEALCMAGGLQSEGDGHYGLPDDVARDFRREQRRLLDSDRRADVVHVIVDQILADLPHTESLDFEPQSWLGMPLPDLGRSPNELVAAGGAPYDDLTTRLRALARMAAGGEEPIDDMLGLPLEGARYRAVDRQAARRAREAAERLQRLHAAAARTLGSEAALWLHAPIEEAGESPLTLASRGDTGLDRCLATIAAIGRQRDAERAEAAAVAARRDKLQEAVARLYPPNLRELALKNQSPVLGCSPWEACSSDHGLDSAIRILTAQAGGRGRRR